MKTSAVALEWLKPLLGLKLLIAGRAADMRIFCFGPPDAPIGRRGYKFALHVQCAWRIEGADGIITGRSDLWEPIGEARGLFDESWDYDKDGNRQDERMDALLRSVNGGLVVESAQADEWGGVTLGLSGGYRLAVFPAGSIGEDWRLFQPGSTQPHYVVNGGRMEIHSDAG